MRGTTRKLAVAAAIASMAIAGCGGSDDEKKDDAANPNSPAAATAAQEAAEANIEKAALKVEQAPKPAKGSDERQWARELCAAMADATTPVKQPKANSSDIQTVQRSFVRFFDQVGSQLGAQLKALEAIGAPPIKGSEADWQRTVGGMTTVQGQMEQVEKQMKAADLKNKQDLEAFMKGVGEQMQTLTTYRGPVATLALDPKIGPAVIAEPSCKKYI